MKNNSTSLEKEFLAKILKYCAYRERSWKEVEDKLLEWQVPHAMQERIIKFIKDEKYVDATRFTSSFIRGKIQIKKWGKLKVKNELIQKKMWSEEAAQSIDDIDENEYIETLRQLLCKKLKSIKDENTLICKSKLYRYALSKGYESNLIHQLLKELLK